MEDMLHLSSAPARVESTSPSTGNVSHVDRIHYCSGRQEYTPHTNGYVLLVGDLVYCTYVAYVATLHRLTISATDLRRDQHWLPTMRWGASLLFCLPNRPLFRCQSTLVLVSSLSVPEMRIPT